MDENYVSEFFDKSVTDKAFDGDAFSAMRVAAGFGLGSTKLDNDLIADAFILGAGFIAGAVTGMSDMDDETREDFLTQCLYYAGQCLPEEQR